ncbi:Phage protein [Mannheimia varigena USDA-ARS-USMARC-1296]|uniref:Phage protein n=1 Tax=Mannheimia varigena USDA-ARS-USMARC-1296 TaxID=1433287 RepID=W0QAW9_9PAST|nr:DUF4054 domain-containing protein [Mannheimia varigena]AHG75432.1 Phage protein [Mannheimia varigena USDA-ARS-USMARC-1296]
MNITDFRTMFPVFDDLDDPTIELWAEVAEEHLKASWVLNGKRLDIAMKLMTAHLLHINVGGESDGGSAQNSGIVASASEGSVSVSFATPSTKNAWQHWLAGSPYGLQLWALLKQWSAAGFYIGGLPERKAVRKVGGVFL